MNNKFRWHLGHDIIVFVFHVNNQKAWDVTNKILEIPIPEVYQNNSYMCFCGASIHLLCGSTGVVWQEVFASSKWEAKRISYPLGYDSSATLDFFAISSTAETAI